MIKLQINNFVNKVEDLKTKESEALNTVLQRLAEGEYGFINMLGAQEYSAAAQQVAQDVADWADTLVVIGIGGSDLGGRAIQHALDDLNSKMEVIFAGDTTDPTALDALLDSVDLSGTAFNIISKSGSTTETIAHYLYLQKLVQQKVGDRWTHHFIFTTENNKGLLSQQADKHNVATLPIPNNVGGRFSVLSPVGLLPAAAMELNLDKIIQGAKDAVEEFAEQAQESISYNIAAYQFAHYLEGLKLSVIMPYSVRLYEFSRWYRQLWAESLGKDGKGIMPVQAFGPADQHSQLQYYNQGEELATYTFLKVKDHQASHRIENVGITEVNYLEGVDFCDLINIECDATQASLTKSNRPNITLEISKVDEYALGQLFLIYEIAVVLLAEMLHVDAFDQPGVEDSKLEMYKRLGKA